jgi:hypothetical protein
LDYHQLREEDIQQIIQWGINEGLIEIRDSFKYILYDENGEEMYGVCDSYEEALCEANEEEELVKLLPKQPYATEKMKIRVMGKAEPVMVEQLLAILYTEMFWI